MSKAVGLLEKASDAGLKEVSITCSIVFFAEPCANVCYVSVECPIVQFEMKIVLGAIPKLVEVSSLVALFVQ